MYEKVLITITTNDFILPKKFHKLSFNFSCHFPSFFDYYSSNLHCTQHKNAIMLVERAELQISKRRNDIAHESFIQNKHLKSLQIRWNIKFFFVHRMCSSLQHKIFSCFPSLFMVFILLLILGHFMALSRPLYDKI